MTWQLGPSEEDGDITPYDAPDYVDEDILSLDQLDDMLDVADDITNDPSLHADMPIQTGDRSAIWTRVRNEVESYIPIFVRQTNEHQFMIITDNANAFRRSITRLGPK